MRCATCQIPMEIRPIDGYEVGCCPRCGATAVQDLALVGLLGAVGGAERLLLTAELEALGRGDAVARCPACGRESVRLGLLREQWIGQCGACRTVTLPAGGLEELRWKMGDQRLAEVEEVLDEEAEAAGQAGRWSLFAALVEAAAAAVRWWRRVAARRARRRGAAAGAGEATRLPPPPRKPPV
jgi:Zn-finger nucleic acid-binding protein